MPAVYRTKILIVTEKLLTGYDAPILYCMYLDKPMRDHITPSGWLTLDPMLLTMPKDLGEFVIVHELVHLLAPNHGRLFKLFLHAYLPDWEEREGRLQGFKGQEG